MSEHDWRRIADEQQRRALNAENAHAVSMRALARRSMMFEDAQHKLNQTLDALVAASNALAAEKARSERYREALRKYGQHSVNCRPHDAGWCGLCEALGAEPTPPTVRYVPVLPADPEADARIDALMAKQPKSALRKKLAQLPEMTSGGLASGAEPTPPKLMEAARKLPSVMVTPTPFVEAQPTRAAEPKCLCDFACGQRDLRCTNPKHGGGPR